MGLQIVADENIPLVREAFAAFGDVQTLPGRAMEAAAVRGADVLLVRSVTRVGPALLEGSRVRFVGTATIGTDHIDLPWLQAQGIAFSAAPGSNADSVAVYLTAVLAEASLRLGRPLEALTLGVVGVGNVGRRVAAKAAALGMRVLLNDPPRARAEGPAGFAPLERLVEESDLLTLHVPLTRTGPDATWHLAGADLLGRLRDGAILINASRGDVVDGAALLPHLTSQRLIAALDVWPGEPLPDPALLRAAWIASAHTAGYSLDGKVRGATMLRDALLAHLGAPDDGWRPDPWLPPPPPPHTLPPGTPWPDALLSLTRAVWPLADDDAALRHTLASPDPERAAAFDRLRKRFPVRRELDHHTVCAGDEALAARCLALGFNVRTGAL